VQFGGAVEKMTLEGKEFWHLDRSQRFVGLRDRLAHDDLAGVYADKNFDRYSAALEKTVALRTNLTLHTERSMKRALADGPPVQGVKYLRCAAPSARVAIPMTPDFALVAAILFGRRCAKWGAENPADASFCKQCGARLGGIVAPPAERISVSAEQADGAAFDGERETVTALFADIKGSMELIEDIDPEEARAVVDPALKLMMEVVQRHDGYVAQSTGGGVAKPPGEAWSRTEVGWMRGFIAQGARNASATNSNIRRAEATRLRSLPMRPWS
jgi:ribosomal protein L40E